MASATAPADSEGALKRVVGLLYTNLAISLVIAALTFALWNKVIDYQLAHLPGGAPADPASERHSLSLATWIAPVVIFAVSVLYVRIATQLKQGRRRTYIRVLVIAVAGMIGLAYPTLSGQYPAWMRIGHAAQELVLLALLLSATRPAVRARFSKPRVA
ncbi:hypothetical protein [Streptomyces sp. NPDC101150]|uniref:hypothetical protein n=1 Tax=Streptomyces sp. NPDC101150 TaxID=3366114 RepID=UPI003816EB8F